MFPKKHEGKQWFYDAQTTRENSVGAWPYGDAKSAGVFVEQSVKRGWWIQMTSYADGVRISKYLQDDEQRFDAMAYVGERACGCVAAFCAYVEDDDKAKTANAKIVRAFAEQKLYIYTRPMQDVHVVATCPHIPQQTDMMDELRKRQDSMQSDEPVPAGDLNGDSAELSINGIAGLLPSGVVEDEDIVDGEFVEEG